MESIWCHLKVIILTKVHFPLLVISGSTGKPKGVLHTVGGYMLYTAVTFKYVNRTSCYVFFVFFTFLCLLYLFDLFDLFERLLKIGVRKVIQWVYA